MEAIRSRNRLAVWEPQLSQGHTAIDAVREALPMWRMEGRLAQGTTLKQAATWYRNAMPRLGVQGHALRYAWARLRMDAHLVDGVPIGEALARTRMDLGIAMGVECGSRWFICGERLDDQTQSPARGRALC